VAICCCTAKENRSSLRKKCFCRAAQADENALSLVKRENVPILPEELFETDVSLQ
jgi:hypothetical protein